MKVTVHAPHSPTGLTSILVDSIGLAGVLGHLVVDKVDYIRPDGGSEHSWQ